jgi:hypothetical protein
MAVGCKVAVGKIGRVSGMIKSEKFVGAASSRKMPTDQEDVAGGVAIGLNYSGMG